MGKWSSELNHTTLVWETFVGKDGGVFKLEFGQGNLDGHDAL